MKTNDNAGESPLSKWEDTTCYSRGETIRVPRTWQRKFGRIRLVVTRHKDYGDDIWRVVCYDVSLEQTLYSQKIENAVVEAIDTLRGRIKEMLNSIVD